MQRPRFQWLKRPAVAVLAATTGLSLVAGVAATVATQTSASALPVGPLPTVTLYATSQVPISGNATAQAAGDLILAIPAGSIGSHSAAFHVGVPLGGNCASTTNFIGFGGSPTTAVGIDPLTPLPASVAPILPTVSNVVIQPDGTAGTFQQVGGCSPASGVNDQIVVTWTSTNATNAVDDIVLSKVTYNVGSAVATAGAFPAIAAPAPITVVIDDGATTIPGPCPGGTNPRFSPGASLAPSECGSAADAAINANGSFVGPPANNGPANIWQVAATNPTSTGAPGAVGGFIQTAPLPVISGLATAQSVNGWTVQVPDDFGTGDNLVFIVDPPFNGVTGGYNFDCTTANGNVGFSGTPTVTVNANGDAPTFTPNVTLTSSFNLTNAKPAAPLVPPGATPDAGCTAAGVNNELVIGATNAGPVAQPGTPAATRPDQTITISGVKYTATGNVPTGPVTVTVYAVPTNAATSDELGPVVDPTATFGLSNAVIYHGTVAGPTTLPTVQVAGAQTIGNLTYTETQNGDVPTGSQVCFQLLTTGVFWHTTSTTPTVTVDSSSGATASSTATGVNKVLAGPTQLAFTVTKASSNGPATFTVNNVSVDILAGTPAGPIAMTAGLLAGGNCVVPNGVQFNGSGTGVGSVGNFANVVVNNVGDGLGNGFVGPLPPGVVLIGNISAGNNRLAGFTRDETAATIFDTEAPCFGNNQAIFTANNNPAVLAFDGNFPDALSAQYAAGALGTGILLTGTDNLPASTIAAMQLNGVQTVFVVGGSAVIDQNVLNQLANTPAFVCGGTGPRLNSQGQPINLNVKVLAGPTRYDTNRAIDDFFPSPACTVPNGFTGCANFTTNAFNPILKTAFVSTGTNFPDALAAGAQSSEEGYPIILTDGTALSQQAIAQITDLGIQQIIVVGGPQAVSTSVVTSLQGLSGIKKVFQVYGADRTGTAVCIAAFNLAEVNATVTSPLATTTGAFGQACVDPGGSTSPVGLVWGPDNVAPNGDNWAIGAPISQAPGGAPAVGLARGDAFPDALTAGPFLGVFNDAPLLLTEDANTLGSATSTFLGQIGVKAPAGFAPISGLVVFGGSQAVSDATVTAAQQAL